MKNDIGNLVAPFPWFGGKSRAADLVWQAFGRVQNYVEPFAGSAAMLLAAPDGKRLETINDKDGFVANFWRAVAADPQGVAEAADWPVNEVDLFARHSWLVREAQSLRERLESDPAAYDARTAGWWAWGACNWIGAGWCSGDGPWVHDGEKITLGDAGQGINRKIPHLGDAGQGINRKIPHLGGESRFGICLNKNPGVMSRGDFILAWMMALHDRLRDVRVACGDWQRVCSDSVTTRHGLTAVFLDPPYTKGDMQYSAGGVGGDLAMDVQRWCAANGSNKLLRIVLCGHAGEHDALLSQGWTARFWKARKGYALTEEARENYAGETVWCSPHCEAERGVNADLFAEAA